MMINQLENNGTYLGFTKTKTALQAGKVEKCLDKKFRYSDGIMARKDAVLLGLRKGKVPAISEEICNGKIKKSYRLEWEHYYCDITKTEYDFCMYLIENNLVTEENVNVYISQEKAERKIAAENEAREAAEVKIAEEKEQKEKEEFRKWLQDKAESYHYSRWMELAEKIYLSIYGELPCQVRINELFVCIENIENPLCREELKARLHTDNKASRKVFMCCTGLKLPNTNRDTMEFLDNVKLSDYAGTKEFKERNKEEKYDVPAEEKQIFYIIEAKEVEGKREHRFKMVYGWAVEKKGIKFFIHEMPDGKFGVSSVECGLRLAIGNSRAAAVKELTKVINKVGIVKVKEGIEKAIAAFGKCPCYEQA